MSEAGPEPSILMSLDLELWDIIREHLDASSLRLAIASSKELSIRLSRGEKLNKLYSSDLARYVKLLDWAKNNARRSTGKFEDFWKLLASLGYLEALKWAIENKYPLSIKGISIGAAVGGHIHVLEWARDNKLLWKTEDIYIYATHNGNFEVMKWLKENEFPYHDWICATTAHRGRLDILRWLRENDFPWGVDTCAMAASGGHLEVLKWARENGCPWDKQTRGYAEQHNHIEILKWAIENGCP